jgi:hypothetical protein
MAALRWPVLLALLTIPHPAAAQSSLTHRGEGQAHVAAANVAIGAIGALAHALLTGSDRTRAIQGGALGGIVTYGGMRMVGSGPIPLRAAGMQVTAVGTSVSRNAGRGVPLLSDLDFPLLPFWIRVQTDSTGTDVDLSLSLATTVAVITLHHMHPEAKLNLRESLASGGPVMTVRGPFLVLHETPEHSSVTWGQALWGAWVAADGPNPQFGERVDRHEAVHAAQHLRGSVSYGRIQTRALLGTRMEWLLLDFIDPVWGLSDLHASLRGGNSRNNLIEREVDAVMGVFGCARHKTFCGWPGGPP